MFLDAAKAADVSTSEGAATSCRGYIRTTILGFDKPNL